MITQPDSSLLGKSFEYEIINSKEEVTGRVATVLTQVRLESAVSLYNFTLINEGETWKLMEYEILRPS